MSNQQQADLFSDLATSPCMYPEEIDFENRVVSFCRMNRETYSRSPFLDERKLRIDRNNYKVRLDYLLNSFGSRKNPPAAINWIFHTPHSGSTLIARALNEIAGCFVLKEPTLLIQASSLVRHPEFPEWKRSGDWQRFFTMVQELLSRTFTETDVTLIKTTSVCHNLVTEIFEGERPARGLFLYSSLEKFLISLYKHDYLDAYIKAGFQGATHDIHQLQLMTRDEPDKLPRHRKAALLWLSIALNLNTYIRENPGNKMLVLDCQQFFADREGSLMAVSNHFGYAHDASSIKAIVNGTIFARDAKSEKKTWNESEYLGRSRDTRKHFCKEIDDALGWAEQIAGSKGHTLPIPVS